MKENEKFVTMDGNEACAYTAYAFTEVAAIYPITPSSPMAGKTDAWSAKGKLNLFGQRVSLVEMESEAGAAGAIHGALEAGALAASFTSSQGLLLMIPVMHRIAGERLPGVLHVASRTVGTHALSIFGDHSDVMNCRQTGFALLSSANAQEVLDLAAVAHLAAVEGRIPFLHFFDGFRTSHEMSKVQTVDYSVFGELLNRRALEEFRAQALNPEHPRLRATVQNPDIYFQVREANNLFYDALPGIVQNYMDKLGAVTGRRYRLFDYYGAPDADRVVVAMGSVSGAVREVVDYLNSAGEKTGFVQVHLYRPFAADRFLASLPATVKQLAVLDRCKESGAAGEPLYQDVCSVCAGRPVRVTGGRYGLSSKDVDPGQIKAVFDHLKNPACRGSFTIGIQDDVTHLSLPVPAPLYPDDRQQICCKFWGLGSDGTVGANKSTVEIINAHTQKYAQAYFEYDAKKSFGITKSHLRFGDLPVRGSYYVKEADFIGCHNQTYIQQYDVAEELKKGGTLLLNTQWSDSELETQLPPAVKRVLAEKKAKLYLIDAVKIAADLGLGNHYNLVLQSAFFHLAGVIPPAEADNYMKTLAERTYISKGEEVVKKNFAAIDAGGSGYREFPVPAVWADLVVPPSSVDTGLPPVVRNLAMPINCQKGDDLPVSAFRGYEDGAVEVGLTAYEKRGIAVNVPVWEPGKCLQCNRCSLVCPHAVIRPYLLNDGEKAAAPADFDTLPVPGKAGLHFALQISTADCTGCGACVQACPAKVKALSLRPYREIGPNKVNWEYGLALSDKGDVFSPQTVKGSQFRRPLVEFSAACAGCGETPYAKLLTQLFGDRIYWANATGCSQAWGSPMPGIPYTVNRQGRGPAWSNSLFENNAEFSLGMALAVKQQREAVKSAVEKLAAAAAPELTAAAQAYLAGFDDYAASRSAGDKLAELLTAQLPAGAAAAPAEYILRHRDQLAKKSFWMFGGDGWAYDIGFGGLDHVLAGGEPVKVLIVDTEVYSNTGGQSSKATPIGAVAQFASSGKKTLKKDLGRIFMTYGSIYVAQVAMGADPNQLLKALWEAENYDGPAIVIAYTPCLSHGLKCGMGRTQEEMKRAVAAGYWTLYRFNPEGTPAFTLDSGEPTLDFEEFLQGENRYALLGRTFPENAAKFFAGGRAAAADRYRHYRRLADLSGK